MSSAQNVFSIRPAKYDDCDAIAALVRELSIFEKIEDQLKIGADELRRDGFGDRPWFKCVVAEKTDTEGSKSIIGFGLFYFVYSTFQGRSAHLEDLYVQAQYREKGIGSRMLEKIAQIVLEEGCVRLDFIVLTWNRAVGLYIRLGAIDLSEKEDWHLWRLEQTSLKALAEKSS